MKATHASRHWGDLQRRRHARTRLQRSGQRGVGRRKVGMEPWQHQPYRRLAGSDILFIELMQTSQHAGVLLPMLAQSRILDGFHQRFFVTEIILQTFDQQIVRQCLNS
jgi:hypothetical protein